MVMEVLYCSHRKDLKSHQKSPQQLKLVAAVAKSGKYKETKETVVPYVHGHMEASWRNKAAEAGRGSLPFPTS